MFKEHLEHFIEVRGTREEDVRDFFFVHFHDSVYTIYIRIIGIPIKCENSLCSPLVMLVAFILWSCPKTIYGIFLVRVIWYENFMNTFHTHLILVQRIWIIFVYVMVRIRMLRISI